MARELKSNFPGSCAKGAEVHEADVAEGLVFQGQSDLV